MAGRHHQLLARGFPREPLLDRRHRSGGRRANDLHQGAEDGGAEGDAGIVERAWFFGEKSFDELHQSLESRELIPPGTPLDLSEEDVQAGEEGEDNGGDASLSWFGRLYGAAPIRH